jgi:hypothetical protein
MDSFKDRLNQIIPRITSDELLKGSGLGNEIGFYIFDYPPEKEIEVRAHIEFILNYIPKIKPNLRIKHINLFALMIDYLKDRKLLERVFQIHKEKGDAEVLKALKTPLGADKIAKVFVKNADPQEHDIVLASGVGNSYPILRVHHLLNNLQPLMGNTPLIIFYPGQFTGQGLRLFPRLEENNYYRAFRLVT